MNLAAQLATSTAIIGQSYKDVGGFVSSQALLLMIAVFNVGAILLGLRWIGKKFSIGYAKMESNSRDFISSRIDAQDIDRAYKRRARRLRRQNRIYEAKLRRARRNKHKRYLKRAGIEKGSRFDGGF